MGAEQLGESVAGTAPGLQGESSRDCLRGVPQPQEAGGACPTTPAPPPVLPAAAHPGTTPQVASLGSEGTLGNNSSPAGGSQALSRAPRCSEQSKAGESWHLVEYACSGKSKCAGCSRPIEAGALRQGARREAGGRITTRWRHWECMTAQLVSKIGGLANLRGYEALQQADQELVRATLASPPKLQRKRRQADAVADCEKEESPATSAAAPAAAPAPAAAADPPATKQPRLTKQQVQAAMQPAAAALPVAAVRLPLPAASPMAAVRLPLPAASPVAAVRLPAASPVAAVRLPLFLLPPVQQALQQQQQLSARAANLMRRLVEPPPMDPLQRLARSTAQHFLRGTLGWPGHRPREDVEAWVDWLGALGVPREMAIAELAAELGLA